MHPVRTLFAAAVLAGTFGPIVVPSHFKSETIVHVLDEFAHALFASAPSVATAPSTNDPTRAFT
jgi:hypothetical protein